MYSTPRKLLRSLQNSYDSDSTSHDGQSTSKHSRSSSSDQELVESSEEVPSLHLDNKAEEMKDKNELVGKDEISDEDFKAIIKGDKDVELSYFIPELRTTKDVMLCLEVPEECPQTEKLPLIVVRLTAGTCLTMNDQKLEEAFQVLSKRPALNAASIVSKNE